jgi:tRNA modification GTPase
MLLPDGQTTVELLDTAGMEAVSPSDDLETAMHTHARQAGQTADGVVWVVDLAAEVGPLPFPPSNRPTLLVGSKCDLLPPSEISRRLAAWHSPLDETPGCRPAIAFSAQTGVGLADLRRRIAELVAGDRPSLGEGRVFLTSRHRDALLRADQALRRILDMLCGSSSPCPDKVLAGPELLAVELREALDHLGRMVGATLPDDLLDVIFSRFCIGK